MQVRIRRLRQRADDGHAGVIDQPVESLAFLLHGLDGRVDVFLRRDVEAQRFDIVDSVELIHVRVFPRARKHEIALRREPFDDVAPDAGARARNEHGPLVNAFVGTRYSQRGTNEQCGQRGRVDEVFHRLSLLLSFGCQERPSLPECVTLAGVNRACARTR